MVLGAHGEALDARVEGWALRHRPAHQHAIVLKPKIIVQPRRRVLLHHEHAAGVLDGPAGRLCRLLEIALTVVLVEIADLIARLYRFARHVMAYFFARF